MRANRTRLASTLIGCLRWYHLQREETFSCDSQKSSGRPQPCAFGQCYPLARQPSKNKSPPLTSRLQNGPNQVVSEELKQEGH